MDIVLKSFAILNVGYHGSGGKLSWHSARRLRGGLAQIVGVAGECLVGGLEDAARVPAASIRLAGLCCIMCKKVGKLRERIMLSPCW